jgi:coenzyme PQQ synthesis protein D (PqqD)
MSEERPTTLRLRSDELEWKQIDDEIVVLDGRASNYLAASGSGVLLWRMLEAGTTMDKLVAAVVEGYAVAEARARADVESFLADLAEQGLLAT